MFHWPLQFLTVCYAVTHLSIITKVLENNSLVWRKIYLGSVLEVSVCDQQAQLLVSLRPESASWWGTHSGTKLLNHCLPFPLRACSWWPKYFLWGCTFSKFYCSSITPTWGLYLQHIGLWRTISLFIVWETWFLVLLVLTKGFFSLFNDHWASMGLSICISFLTP